MLEYAFSEGDKNTPLPSPPLSKEEVLRNIGRNISIGNLILGVSSVSVSYLKVRQVFYYKMRQFYYKVRRLLQIVTVHSVTFIPG